MDFVGMWPGLNVSAITTGSSVLNNLLVLPAAVSTLLFPCYLLFIQAITCRLGGFFGRGKQLPGASPDSFVAWERPVALRKLLCNIGPTGCAVAGAGPGVIVASPSKHDPDCWFSRLSGPTDADGPAQTSTLGPATQLWYPRVWWTSLVTGTTRRYRATSLNTLRPKPGSKAYTIPRVP